MIWVNGLICSLPGQRNVTLSVPDNAMSDIFTDVEDDPLRLEVYSTSYSASRTVY